MKDFFPLNAGEKSYTEHEFKFDKIHDWINEWASPKVVEMLDKNIRQKWIVAASSILESTLPNCEVISSNKRGSGRSSLMAEGGFLSSLKNNQ